MSTAPGPGDERLRALFDELVELPPDARAARLADPALPDGLRARLAALLAAGERPSPLLDQPVAQAIEVLRDDADWQRALQARRIGGFRIGALLGEGGSSVVFHAERDAGDGVQQVALKLLRHGLHSPEARQRFRREQAILATLDHPNIARLVEAGVEDDGLPYIAMERVDGVPITEHAAARGLGLRERLALFETLCRAVDAAHAALVVHRDLKPSNVLVTGTGAVKVLDFGIAKLIGDDDPQTRTRGIVLTPEYAAPEQFRPGPATTAVDVYALGVILGELLTGLRLNATTTRDASAAVTGEPTAPPPGLPERRLLARSLRGDLDAIIATAMADDPGRRYRSAGALADDVARWLDGRPVVARPSTRWYRARKFVGRHRGGVLLTAVLSLAVLAALSLALWQADVARREAARATAVRDFLVSLFDAARAQLPRDERPTPAQLVREAQARLDAGRGLDAATRADLLAALAEVSLSAGESKLAEDLALRAQALLRDESASLVGLQARAIEAQGRHADAIALLSPRVAAWSTNDPVAAASAHATLADASIGLGQLDEGIAQARAAAVLAARRAADDPRAALAAELDLGNALQFARRSAEAIEVLAPALSRWQAAGLPLDASWLAALGNLAIARLATGATGNAEADYAELLAHARRIYDPPHSELSAALANLGSAQWANGRLDAAQASLAEALAMDRALHGDLHADVVASLSTLAALSIERGRLDEALDHHRAALVACTAVEPDGAPCRRTRLNLGINLLWLDRPSEARRELETALAQRRALLGDAHPEVGAALAALALVDLAGGRPGEALARVDSALAMFEAAAQDASAEAATIRRTRAEALWRLGRAADALPEVDRALADFRRAAPGRRGRIGAMQALRAEVLVALGRDGEAAATAREALSLMQGVWVAGEWRQRAEALAGTPPAG